MIGRTTIFGCSSPYRSIDRKPFVAMADRKLKEDMSSGEAAAILIWLRCIGEAALINRSVQSFSSSLPYQNARIF